MCTLPEKENIGGDEMKERERKKERKDRAREREREVSSNASIHVLTISDVSNSSISSDSPSWFKGVERARRVPLEVVNGL